ncbi:DUF1465 family protein [Rhodobacteraceae bacterium RKSG542]|uniref:protease adaptor protein RcdA n=1 Tax=Pseudovibrio flavus TaxID=2529854 RepID=UPI0012BC628D|nr:DUF1465 family protein [Pseudovibrio flavus]MTI16576.1 DUF1465 family protein [Pseudovibrio flavus]
MSDIKRLARTPTVSFADHLIGSNGFNNLFNEGMALVEETAAYLDGEGRSISRELSRPASLAYATESMRLTTRLMQLASWLLLQRAVNEGEMTAEQAASEKFKVRLDREKGPNPSDGEEKLPTPMLELVARSLRLQERVKHMDSLLHDQLERQPVIGRKNPVADQMTMLSAAFAAD